VNISVLYLTVLKIMANFPVLHHYVVMFYGSLWFWNVCCLGLKIAHIRNVDGVASFIAIDEQLQ